MKKKVVREVEILVKVVESKRLFKLSVEDDTRLKTIANKLCRLMELDPFCTEWAFFSANDDHYEIPISFTIRQIQNGHQLPSLLAKIMTTALKQDYFVTTTVGVKTDTHWRRRIEHGQTTFNEASVQTDPIDDLNIQNAKEPQWHPGSSRTSANTDALIHNTGRVSSAMPKQPRVIYTMYGIKKLEPRVNVKFEDIEVPDIQEIWTYLKKIEVSKVLRGLNVVGYCPNNRCINYCRWINISLGFGRYTLFDIDLHQRKSGKWQCVNFVLGRICTRNHTTL